MTIIYRAICRLKVSGKTLVYIGQTKQVFEERIIQHKTGAALGKPTAFYQALLDYGRENWDWEVLEQCSDEVANQRERFFIEKFSSDFHITILNTSIAQKIKQSNAVSKSFPTIKKQFSHERSKLGEWSLRVDGRIKPVINLETNEKYPSALAAARAEGISIAKLRNSCSTGKMLKDRTRYAYLDIEDRPILTAGHSREIFIGKNAKKVKNLVNGKVYDSAAEAAKVYKVSSGVIDGAARGEYAIIDRKHVFCFLDADGKEIRTAKHETALKKLESERQINYYAWHVDDVDQERPYKFKTLAELCEFLKIKNTGHVKSVCDGNRSHAEKWRIAKWNQEKQQPIFFDKHLKKPNKIIRKLVCLNDNKLFDSPSVAGKYYGIDSQGIAKVCTGRAKSVYCLDGRKRGARLRFAYVDELDQPKLTNKHRDAQRSLAMSRNNRILLVNPDMQKQLGQDRFNSIAEFCRITGIPPKRVRKYMNEPTTDMFGCEFIKLN